jgi:glycosyltransferase involved in cell wall biosynthesis
MRTRPHVVFFAKVQHPHVLERVEFYAQDIAMLRAIGCDVTIVTDPRQLVPADLYFVWWWTWAAIPVAYARLRGRPVCITGVFDLWAFPPRPWWHRALIRFALRCADANVFVSRMEYEAVPRALAVQMPSVNALGVDTDVYAPGSAPRAAAQLLTIAGMHGDNAVRKGVPETIEACAILRSRGYPVTIVVGGERGSGYPSLVALAERLGVEAFVSFPGVLSRDAKVHLMQGCTCYLQPSRFEGFGLAMLEAMSCGAPVVARPGGAVAEVLGDAGTLVSTEGAIAIADAVEPLLADPDRAALIGAAARDRALTQFSVARRREEMTRVLQPLFAKATRPTRTEHRQEH